jgi:hypothetical protein
MNGNCRLDVLRWSVLAVLIGGGPALADAVTVAANVPVEIAFSAEADHPDPFHGITLDVVFRTPAGRSLRVPAFWAGGRSWKVRYASGEVGIHCYRAECRPATIAGLHGAEGSVEVTPYVGENPLFGHGPIRVADDRRHLAHADGTPFFWLGDTWWMGLSHRLRFPDDFARLAADRKAKGFTVIQIVAGLYPDMPPFDPRGANEAGFPWEKDYTRIRPEYFDAADKKLRYLVDQGLSPCVVGMWGYFLPWMGVDKAQKHWRYLIARYGAWPVTWCVAGEANLPWYLAKGFPFDDREQVRGWTEVLSYVRETDPFRRPLTIHPTAINQYTARHATDDPALLDFDMLQTPHGEREAAYVTLKAVRDSYNAKPTMPVLDGEASYEQLLGRIPAEWTRAMFWIGLTGGAAGHTYGANGIWQVNRKGDPHGASPHGGNYGTIPWDEAMNLPGSSQVAAGKRLLENYPWHRFEPHPEWVAWDDAATGMGLEDLGHWVWFPEGDATKDAPVAPRYFRLTFAVRQGQPIRRARLRVAADDRFTAWINGRKVGEGAGWGDPQVVDVTTALVDDKGTLARGRNVLTIRAENMPAPVKLNPAGLRAGLEIELTEGANYARVATNGRWRASREEVPGWLEARFDDSSWPFAADLGPAGIAPWGRPQPREAFPPLAFGLPDGPRVIYALDPKPILLRGLDPKRTYRIVEFNPATGESRPAGDLDVGPDGTARRRAPTHGHDRVVVLIPDLQP